MLRLKRHKVQRVERCQRDHDGVGELALEQNSGQGQQQIVREGRPPYWVEPGQKPDYCSSVSLDPESGLWDIGSLCCSAVLSTSSSPTSRQLLWSSLFTTTERTAAKPLREDHERDHLIRKLPERMTTVLELPGITLINIRVTICKFWLGKMRRNMGIDGELSLSSVTIESIHFNQMTRWRAL